MDKHPRFLHLILAAALLAAVLFAGVAALLLSQTDAPAFREQIRLTLAVAALSTALLLAALFLAMHLLVFLPLKMLGHEIRIISRVNPGYSVDLSGRHLLGDIPDAINELGQALLKAKREIAGAVSASARDLEDSRTRLETILTATREGIIVCDERGRILFYNPAAKKVFLDNEALGIGRSLYQLCTAAPIENSLAVLKLRRLREPEERQEENALSFVCSTLIGTMIHCSIRLLPIVPDLSWSFLLTCEDVSREASVLGLRENMLRRTMQEMRSTLTRLTLNLQSLEMLSDLQADNKAELDRSMVEEARDLTGQFAIISREIDEMAPDRLRVGDVFTEDVIACVARRLAEEGLQLTLTGDPLWVRTDIHTLLLLLEFLAKRVFAFSRTPAIEIETLLGDKRVYFNLVWQGAPVPEAEIRAWKSGRLAHPKLRSDQDREHPAGGYKGKRTATKQHVGHGEEPHSVADKGVGLNATWNQDSEKTVGEVLEDNGSEVWSSPHETPGYAMLRFPMPCSSRQWEPVRRNLPSRPVYSDFIVYEISAEREMLQDLALARIPFVVFDTETTGLAPLAGDAIVSLAGVKIVNRGILVGETFDRLVNPGRSIPPASTAFHGITDDMVRTMPRIEKILPLFHDFVGQAVLVGHNAAFDMRFIQLKEGRANVSFQGPVLDTLALSHFLHGHAPGHSLDAVARRLGVEIRDRHTALGDSLITAQVFLKFLYILEKQGIVTLRQMLAALEQ